MDEWLRFLQHSSSVDKTSKKKIGKARSYINIDTVIKKAKINLRVLKNVLEDGVVSPSTSINAPLTNINEDTSGNISIGNGRNKSRHDNDDGMEINRKKSTKGNRIENFDVNKDKKNYCDEVINDSLKSETQKQKTNSNGESLENSPGVSQLNPEWGSEIDSSDDKELSSNDDEVSNEDIPCKIVRLHHKPNLEEYSKYNSSLMMLTQKQMPGSVFNPYYFLMNLYPKCLIPPIYNEYDKTINISELNSVSLPTISTLITRHFNNDACFYFPHKKLWNISNQKNIIRKTLDINATMHLIDRCVLVFTHVINNLVCPPELDFQIPKVSFPRISSCFRNLYVNDKEFIKGAILLVDTFTIMCPETKSQLSQYFSSELYEEYKKDKWYSNFDKMPQDKVKRTIISRFNEIIKKYATLLGSKRFYFSFGEGIITDVDKSDIINAMNAQYKRTSCFGLKNEIAQLLYDNLVNTLSRISWYDYDPNMIPDEGFVKITALDGPDEFLGSSYKISMKSDQSIELPAPPEIEYECGPINVSLRGTKTRLMKKKLGQMRNDTDSPKQQQENTDIADNFKYNKVSPKNDDYNSEVNYLLGENIKQQKRGISSFKGKSLDGISRLTKQTRAIYEQQGEISLNENSTRQKMKKNSTRNILNNYRQYIEDSDETFEGAGNEEYDYMQYDIPSKRKGNREKMCEYDNFEYMDKRKYFNDDKYTDEGEKITLSRIIEDPNDDSPINCRPNCSLYRYRKDKYEPPDLTSFNINLSISQQESPLFDDCSVDSLINCGVQLSINLKSITFEDIVGKDKTHLVEETYNLYDDSYVKYGLNTGSILNHAYKAKRYGSESGKTTGNIFSNNNNANSNGILRNNKIYDDFENVNDVVQHNKQSKRKQKDSDDKYSVNRNIYNPDDDYSVSKHLDTTQKEISAKFASIEDNSVHIDIQIEKLKRLKVILTSWCRKYDIPYEKTKFSDISIDNLSEETKMYFGCKKCFKKEGTNNNNESDIIEGPPPPKMSLLYADLIKTLYENDETEFREDEPYSNFNILDYVHETPIAAVPIILNRVDSLLTELYKSREEIHENMRIELCEYYYPCVVTEHIAKYYSRRDTKIETVETRLTKRKGINRSHLTVENDDIPYPFPLNINKTDDLLFIDPILPSNFKDINLDYKSHLTLKDYCSYSNLKFLELDDSFKDDYINLFKSLNMTDTGEKADIQYDKSEKNNNRRQNVYWKPKTAFILLIFSSLINRAKTFKCLDLNEFCEIFSMLIHGICDNTKFFFKMTEEDIIETILENGIIGLDKKYGKEDYTILLANNDIAVFLIFISILARRLELIYCYLTVVGGIDRGVYTKSHSSSFYTKASQDVLLKCEEEDTNNSMETTSNTINKDCNENISFDDDEERNYMNKLAMKFIGDRPSYMNCLDLPYLEYVHTNKDNDVIDKRHALKLLVNILNCNENKILTIAREYLGEYRHVLMNVIAIINILFNSLIKMSSVFHGSNFTYKQLILLDIVLSLLEIQTKHHDALPYITTSFVDNIIGRISHKDSLFIIETIGPMMFISSMSHKPQNQPR